MSNKKEIGNPYGAGRYSYTRSSTDSGAMLLDDQARFDPKSNRWFEHMGCGYACERDGIALQEADDADLYDFHRDNPKINCRESMYDLQYGDTRAEVAHAFFLLMEYAGGKYRSFYFGLDDVSMQEMEKYIAAVENWHSTGELNIGPHHGCPNYGDWEES